jgi:hypothetical protein
MRLSPYTRPQAGEVALPPTLRNSALLPSEAGNMNIGGMKIKYYVIT